MTDLKWLLACPHVPTTKPQHKGKAPTPTDNNTLDPVVEIAQEENAALLANLQPCLLELVVVLGHCVCQVTLLHKYIYRFYKVC